jgi:LysM repeat protein
MASLGFKPLAKIMIVPVPAGSAPPFIAMYNPPTLSITRSQTNTSKSTTQTGEPLIETLFVDPATLTIDFFLDGTGASPPMGIPTLGNLGDGGAAVGKALGVAVSAVGVELLIKLFFKTTLEVDNSKHNTRVVKLIWGAGLLFRCKLQSYTITYSLINRLGLPLRATISATFIEDKDPNELSINNLQSPDLTKLHTVKAGDTIYNIAKKEYDSESFYLQIAEANDLKNYRKLTPGQKLILPPIKQDEV